MRRKPHFCFKNFQKNVELRLNLWYPIGKPILEGLTPVWVGEKDLFFFGRMKIWQ